MLNLSVLTWIRFVVWLVVGFAIYFGYGYWHARLGKGDLTERCPPKPIRPLTAESEERPNRRVPLYQYLLRRIPCHM